MFAEKNTETTVLKRMLDKVPNDLDKRESSVIYNTLAPAALVLSMFYSDLDRFLDYTFIDEETPEVYIEKRTKEIGMDRKQATAAIKKGMFYDPKNNLIDIPLNSRFYIDKINFTAVEKLETGIYKMRCEELGEIGNTAIGNLIPVDYIEGLGSAQLTDIIEEAKDLEEGKDLYYRFSEKERKPTTSGNPNHYKQWALEVEGVGKCKVYPLWNGEGTVKVVLIDSNKKAPSKELIDKVYKHIEDVRPIGPKLTVKGAIEKKFIVTAKIVFIKDTNSTPTQQAQIKSRIEKDFINEIDKYIKNTYFEMPYLSLAKIGNLLLNIEGVLDYSDLKINGTASNLAIQDEEILIVDSVALEG